MKPRLAGAELIGKQLGMFRDRAERGTTLEELVLVAGRRRLPEGAVSIQVVDPYAGRQDTEVEQ